MVFLFVACAVVAWMKKNKESDNAISDIDRIAKVLSTTRPTDILVRGEEIDFGDKVSAEPIDEITTSKIAGSKEYSVVIINDLNDTVELSDAEINVVSDMITCNNYMLIYLGEKYAAVWDEPSNGITDIEGNLCYIYYSWDKVPTRNVGAWNKSDQETLDKYPLSLGEALLYSIEEYLQ